MPFQVLSGLALQWVRLAAFMAAYAGAAILGMMFRTKPENFAIFWPPNGLLLGVLLVVSRNQRYWYVAAAGSMSFVVNSAFGHDLGITTAFTAVNLLESVVAALILDRVGGERFALDRASRIFVLYVTAVIVCSASGLAGGLIVHDALGAPDYWGSSLMFGVADGLAIMLVTPVVLTWSAFDARKILAIPPLRLAEFAFIVAVVIGVGLRLFDAAPGTAPPHRMYAFPVVPFLLWAAVRFGSKEAAAVLGMLSLIAIWHTAHGRGPFSMAAASGAQRLILAQLFLSIVGLTVLALAGAIAERKEIERELRESRERYRMVMETIQEVFWIATPGFQRFEYVSPAYDDVWRRSRDRLALDPNDFGKSILQDDRLHSPLRAGLSIEAREFEYRILRGDGVIRWIRTRVFPVLEADAVTQIVGVSRDITPRKEAELANVKLIGELQTVLAEIKTLRGVVPICAWCKDIRNDTGFWQKLEDYLQTHTEAKFTHGICPSCLDKETAALELEV